MLCACRFVRPYPCFPMRCDQMGAYCSKYFHLAKLHVPCAMIQHFLLIGQVVAVHGFESSPCLESTSRGVLENMWIKRTRTCICIHTWTCTHKHMHTHAHTRVFIVHAHTYPPSIIHHADQDEARKASSSGLRRAPFRRLFAWLMRLLPIRCNVVTRCPPYAHRPPPSPTHLSTQPPTHLPTNPPAHPCAHPCIHPPTHHPPCPSAQSLIPTIHPPPC